MCVGHHEEGVLLAAYDKCSIEDCKTFGQMPLGLAVQKLQTTTTVIPWKWPAGIRRRGHPGTTSEDI